MFPIDRSLLPSLSTRRALIVVDPQNDFLSEDGALPVKIPMDLPERIADLATSFRKSGGDVIWVCSRFEKSRSILEEQVLTSERSGIPRSPDMSRGRRRQASPQLIQGPCECPEAFLTQESAKVPKCVRPGTPGIDIHPVVKEAVGSRDYSVVKSYYSAFRSEQLLRLLRMRLVTELFICGAMTNISIMATAVDAASHGYTITIVDDCCGYHNMMRHRNAVKQIANTTGCDVLSAEGVLASFKPKPKPSRKPSDRPATSPGSRYSSVRRVRVEDDSAASSASDILSSFENLSLSPKRAADTPELEAPTQDLPLPIQPLVSPTRAQSPPVSDAEQPAPTLVVNDVDRRPPTPEENESPSHSNDAQPPTESNKENWATATLSNKIVYQDKVTSRDISDIRPLEPLDKEQNTTVSSTARLKDSRDHSPAATADNSNSSENTKENTKAAAESTSPISSKESIEPTESREVPPPEISKTSTMDANTNSSASTMTPEPSKKRRESHPLAEGDTKIVLNILPDDLLDDIFQKIQDEVKFQAMSHQGGEVPRLVAVQGQVEADGSMPIYRHPADEAPPLLPFTPTVLEIKKVVEKQLGHDLNHVLIQLYRNGEDYISEHSDKTLDIAKGTYIANVSLGAERVMMFRTKRTPKIRNAALMTALEPPREEPAKRQIIRTSLPHNSLCQMGLKTNEKWQHGIRPDKRRDAEKSPEELAFDGGRISLTFRQIGTYLDRDHCFIWGQGATSKTRESARNVINGQSVEAQEMLKAFGRENNLTEFDWDKYYGNGFDVLHISVSPRLFLSADPVINMRVQLMLAELGINYARGSMGLLQFSWKDTAEKSYPIKFVDSDSQKTTVQGELAIMLYLDRFYGQNAQPDPSALSRRNVAAEFTRFQQGLALLDQYREIADTKAFTSELKVWENYAKEGHDFIAGPYMSLADYAFWPVLNDMIRTPGQCEFGDGGSGFECLKEYHERVKNRDSGRKVLVVCATCIRKKPDGTFETTATTSGSGSPFALASTSAVASTSASV